MGVCWNCGVDVFLKESEVRCDRCKEVVRYWCNSCANPFDVQDKETKKKVRGCKWCGYFICPSCNSCSPNCKKLEHAEYIKHQIAGLIALDKWDVLDKKIHIIIDYFEDIKLGKEKTTCELGVPKTYAKERIKNILSRMKGFKVRNTQDQIAFENKQEEILDEDEGYEFTIGNTREDGSYGQEYRDVFNLCVCLGKLEYERKYFKNDKGIEIGYDSWIRIKGYVCPYLDNEELIVKYCPKCAKTFIREKEFCDECSYKTNYKEKQKGDLKEIPLKEKLSDIPTCKNL